MSNKMEQIDWSSFVDDKSAVDLFKNSIMKSIEYDWFAGRSSFKVVALSPSIPLTAKAAAAIPGGSAGDSRNIVAKYIIFGRIIEENSPHSWIPNPCQPDRERGQQETLNLVMAHTVFIVYGDPKAKMMVPIKPGDVFLGKLETRKYSFDMQYGRYLDIVERAGDSQYRLRFADSCDSLAQMFPQFPDFSDGLGIEPKGALYNGVGGNNVPVENGRMPDYLLGQVDTTYSTPATLLIDLIPSWNKLAKAYFDWTGTPEGGGRSKKIRVNSSYRTYENALQICGGIETPPSTRAGKCKNALSSLPGTSRHGWGCAIDWQLSIGWGDKSTASRRKQFNCPEYRWMWANAYNFGASDPSFGYIYWLSPDWARPSCDVSGAGAKNFTEKQKEEFRKFGYGNDFCGEGRLLEAWHWEPNIFNDLISGIK